MVDFSFTPAQKALREEVVLFAQAHLNNAVSQRDQERKFDRNLWKKCGSIGLPGLSIPTQYGGRGLDALDTVIALEALGFASEDGGLNFSLAAHLLACVVPIDLYGTDEQKSRWLPGLCNGDFVATNAMTEPSAGSDVYQMASTAMLEGEHYRINGHKSYCSNGPVADIAVTYALTDPKKGFFGGISAFVLEKSKNQFKASESIEKMGVRTCQLGELYFKDTIADIGSVLGKPGGGGTIFHKSMEWERICLGALHIGAMDRLLGKAVHFAKERYSGGKSIGGYQAVAHPLAELKCRIEASRQLTYKVAWMLANDKKVSAEASMVKLYVSETYRDFALQLHQLLAGAAYRTPNEFERCLRDAMGSTIYSGTSEIQKNMIARYMGLK